MLEDSVNRKSSVINVIQTDSQREKNMGELHIPPINLYKNTQNMSFNIQCIMFFKHYLGIYAILQV